MSRAARWLAWQQRRGNPPGPLRGSSPLGVPWLTDTLGPDTRLVVEIAWGADLAADPDTWSWTDITTDVQQADGHAIVITLGAGDEASTTQPAECSMAVDNNGGAYSLGITSPNWPNVRIGTPLRVRVDLGTGPVVLVQARITSFAPRWSETGRQALVAISASGLLQPLQQGAKPLASAMYRGLTSAALTDVVEYWPAEDGEDATVIASAVGGEPITLDGPLRFASFSEVPASAPLPVFTTAPCTWYAPVRDHTATGSYQIRFFLHIPAGSMADGQLIASVRTSGTAGWYELHYWTGGDLQLKIWTADFGVQLHDSGVLDTNIDGKYLWVSIELSQQGGDVHYNVVRLEVGATVAGAFGGALVGHTVGQVGEVIISSPPDYPPSLAANGVTVGHLVVRGQITPIFDLRDELNAWTGETPTDRLARLAAQNNVPITVVDEAQPGDAELFAMGPQAVDTLVTLLRECETTDQGILSDGLGAGLTYVTRRYRENRPPVVLDVAEGDLSDPPAPAYDDQRIVNEVTAAAKRASSAVYSRTDGPLGTLAAGVHDRAVTISLHRDGQVMQYAAWLVHRGTVDGYRYPRLRVELTFLPALAREWLTGALLPGSRIDILTPADALTGHPPDTISLSVEGYTMEIDEYRWIVTANCSPYEPWLIGTAAADSGDASETALRADPDGSALAERVEVGAASLLVATPSGPLWTTDADDFPLQADVDGMRVTVTGISGASSPQTFTTTGATVTVPRPAGAPVAVVSPALGL